ATRRCDIVNEASVPTLASAPDSRSLDRAREKAAKIVPLLVADRGSSVHCATGRSGQGEGARSLGGRSAMRSKSLRLLALSAAMFGVLLAFNAPTAGAAGETLVYDAVPTTLPGNVSSIGYEATSTREF